jgi:hypothetical protein
VFKSLRDWLSGRGSDPEMSRTQRSEQASRQYRAETVSNLLHTVQRLQAEIAECTRNTLPPANSVEIPDARLGALQLELQSTQTELRRDVARI